MDRLDRKILRLLQEDATLAVADVAKKVGLSTTPCWRRIQKLEEEGVIKVFFELNGQPRAKFGIATRTPIGM